jgi:outer membrane protein TolC
MRALGTRFPDASRKPTCLRLLCHALLAAFVAVPAQPVLAQQPSIEPVRPAGGFYIRPYREASIPPVRVNNSGRLQGLIRTGKLYLSPQDAIGLALENNIDIEVARYAPINLTWQLQRSEAGGALPGVPSAASQVNSVTSGQGVLGSQSAAGVGGGGTGAAAGTSSNATISQIGPVTQTLDPSVQETSTFGHRTAAQANTTQSLTLALVQDSRNHAVTVQQGFLTGGSVTSTFRDSYLHENAATDLLNPSVAQSFSVQLQQSLLQGRGVAVNARNITVAKNNLAMSDLNFRTTVSRTIASVLNSYWSLVNDYEDLKAKQEALDTAQGFVTENEKRVELGALAQIDLVSSRSQLATSRLDLVNSRTALEQQQLQLKNLISRTGAMDPLLSGVDIVPTGSITIPDLDDTPAIKDLIAKALVYRSDLLSEEESLKNSEISATGTRNGLLPAVQVFASASNAGLGGTGHDVHGTTPDPYFIGGAGTAFGQVVRRNFPTESIGASARVSIGNRQAQADYAIDELQYRQSQLSAGRDRNQVAVDVSNSVVALRQARARYEAAHANLTLQQQLLDGEQKKFNLGESTSFNVIQQQRDLAAAKASELAAIVSYQSARINLDSITGTIIETNGVTLDQAKTGQIQ